MTDQQKMLVLKENLYHSSRGKFGCCEQIAFVIVCKCVVCKVMLHVRQSVHMYDRAWYLSKC